MFESPAITQAEVPQPSCFPESTVTRLTCRTYRLRKQHLIDELKKQGNFHRFLIWSHKSDFLFKMLKMYLPFAPISAASDQFWRSPSIFSFLSPGIGSASKSSNPSIFGLSGSGSGR